MQDEVEETHDGIIKPLSSYHHFNKLCGAAIKEDMIREGKDTGIGAVAAAVGAKWRQLSEEERSQYEELAADDRLRYDTEKEKKDEEYLLELEERHKKNAMVETDTRMRGSTLQQTDRITAESIDKKARVLTDKEKARLEEKRKAKSAESAVRHVQQEELKRAKAEQAEARLKYLLSQSDIFGHFGLKKKSPPADASGRPRGDRRVSSSEELDEDEKAMLEEEDEHEDGAPAGHENTILLQQPSWVSGGAMRSYQLEGLNWMIRLHENGINGILADEMGLGKTLQSISLIAYLAEYKNKRGPHLVMVPKSTLSNWCNEFKRWAPNLRVVRFHGSKEERAEYVDAVLRPNAKADEREWDVCITTYEVAMLEKSCLLKIAWGYLIIDEAHRLKNESSQFSTIVRLLQTENRLLLTGTPLQNNLHELWALLNFLLPDVFASSEQFDEWFNLDVDDTQAKQRIIGQLHKLLRPFMLRRLKADVEKSLPPKSETILFTGMSAVQKQLYRQLLLRDIDMINNSNTKDTNNSRTAILNIVMQLRKCCNHPYLFPNIEDRTLDPLADHLYLSCGKMTLVHKLLKKMKERDHRVLMFSQMTRMIDILEDYCISQGYMYCRIDGNTSYDDREDRIADFNAPGSNKFIFLLSTRAGGLGINLQTADTVILYDSDWNPQADLQAQDRAHRIGQKKPVQVFRLVTDDTVEVKVVERAQQKLKLDAMVVQQGRLQDKEKKMSRQDLLDTLRFGADKVFRSKESAITDADIDLILEEGRKRTEEMSEKLKVNDKGDMYDFRLDGGIATQMFEGKDYSDRSMREAEKDAMLGAFFIDTGKRERKAIGYAETGAKAAETLEDRKLKMPRHLRLPKMEDYQFFDRARLTELSEEETRMFDQMAERGEVSAGQISKLVCLPAELHNEKQKLISDAFGDWTRVHYNSFVRASAKHGRRAYDKIAKDVGRPVDDVQRYCETFWSKGPAMLPSAEFDRVVKMVEKGEKRLEEIDRLTSATRRLIEMFDDPLEELTFRNVGSQGRVFNGIEDRYLLCLTHLHGYGNWDAVRASIRKCERFRFDYYLLSCSADALGKRCEALMKSAERELVEIERKRSAAESMKAAASSGAGLSSSGKKASGAAGVDPSSNEQKIAEMTKQISDEVRRLNQQRDKVKALQGDVAVPRKEKKEAVEREHVDETADEHAVESKPPRAPPVRATLVPDGLLPELCKMLVKAGYDGITKVVTQFVAKYPHISKRQTELKIGELAVKEKQDDDKGKVWHIRPQFAQFLDMENFVESEVASPAPAAADEKKRKSNAGVPSAEAPKKKKATAVAVETPAAVPASSASKRKREEELEEPKKYKNAFNIFVKSVRMSAEEELTAKNGGAVPNKEDLKARILAMWDEASDEVKAKCESQEKEDKARYEQEMKVYNAAKKAADKAASSGKKSKAL